MEGVFSHFATENDDFVEEQINNFERLIMYLSDVPIIHMANSYNMIKHPKIPFCNGCRVGLAMYGFFDDNKETFNLVANILQIKDVKANDLILAP